ncbi:kinase-like protein [Thozetella sp. PMI_491]|nr:kinase-like protein [Thozetella sp. PMI_491]
MASHDVSSDEGEIVEATPLPRSEQNGDVDRTGRTRGRYSRTPDSDSFPRQSGDGYRRRSRSPPRGQKRPRDDRDRRDRERDRDPRQFRVHYEDSPRRDRSRDRDRDRDLDRPPSLQSNGPEPLSSRSAHRPGNRDNLPSRPGGYRQRDYERDPDGYPDKRPRGNRSRSRSPRRRDNGRRDRGRREKEERSKYSAQDERYPRNGALSRQANLLEAPDTLKQDAKRDQGVTDGHRRTGAAAAQELDPDRDWDPDAAVDQEVAAEAEIQRRKRAREEALKKALRGSTPSSLRVQLGEKASSTPASTRFHTPTPGLLKTGPNTPRSANGRLDIDSPALSPPAGHNAMSPAVFDFTDDQNLINTHREAEASDEDGPSAADYDPTADMQEDERRDELRNGNVGLHGESKHPQQAATVIETTEEPPKKNDEDEDDAFDMFADDFDAEKYAPPASMAAPVGQDGKAAPANAGVGNFDGDDKDGYYKIRPGEILDGRYQISSALGKGMFSGVARAVDITSQQVLAIKIMRNNDALRKGGLTEIAILQKLNAADPDDKKHIVKFERSFEYKGHLCMAFENLSLNLREVLKKFGNNVGINLNATRAYAYQIFLALGHMRKCSIIHADLKPDNILVNEARNMLKICDLGTAIDRSDAATASTEITPYLVSRFYRAPEIILGMPYDYAVDMWSIGCTLYELYAGKILFTGDSNNQMLKNIMEIRGRLSAKLYRRGQLSNMHFDELGNFVSVERDKTLGKVCFKLPDLVPDLVQPVRSLAHIHTHTCTPTHNSQSQPLPASQQACVGNPPGFY